MAGVIILASAIQLWFFLSDHRGALRRVLESKAVPVTEVASHQLSGALERGDRAQMKEVLEEFLRERNASFAAYFGQDGSLLASAGPDGAARRLEQAAVDKPSHRHDGSLLTVQVPVTAPAGARGTLVAGFTTDSVAADRRAVLWRSFLVTLLIALCAVAVGLGYGATLGKRLGRIALETERIAEGDLSRPALHDERGDEIGRMALAFDRMVGSQRELVGRMNETVLQLNSTAGQFLTTAQQQERGSTEQSIAVEETNRTLTSLLASAREIAQAAHGVLQNAERTQDNTTAMAERIGELSRQVERITEILELIKGIASKSEILALNAALEGTKAGEAGRGFSLVASQMQRLAENVMEAVRDIRNLTDTIRDATQGSVIATEESIKLSNDTTRSARQIALIIEQQQSATEHVSAAIHDVAQVATQTTSASKEIVASTQDVLQLCERLRALVGRFTVDHQHSSADVR
jgi:methyl-accepting chemotaxis protein